MSDGNVWAGPVVLLAMSLYRAFIAERPKKRAPTPPVSSTSSMSAETTRMSGESLARFKAYSALSMVERYGEHGP
jgi:hypothetical protein